jgi:hypothetical protein
VYELAGTPPKRTAVTPVKFAPVNVIIPPVAEDTGEKASSRGTGGNVPSGNLTTWEKVQLFPSITKEKFAVPALEGVPVMLNTKLPVPFCIA